VTPTEPTTPVDPTTPVTPVTPGTDSDLKSAIADVQTALTERADALKSGDLSAYADADKKLVTALNALFALEN